MKTRNLSALAAAVVLLGACIPSVNPFYTEKDLVFDQRLVGEWQEKGKADVPEVWKFEPSGDKGYKLTVSEKPGQEGQFEARLFKLKAELFLDLIPADCNYATNQAGLVALAMFPGHLLVRVGQLDPELKLSFCKFDWLEKFLKENPKSLAHHVEDKRIVLTAKTRDLQKFVLKHLGEGELFDQPGELIRKQSASVAEPTKPELRSSKSEFRRKPELRNPKIATSAVGGGALFQSGDTKRFRSSNFGFLSSFEDSNFGFQAK